MLKTTHNNQSNINLASYSKSIFHRQFKITDDVPTPYARERQVLLGIDFVYFNVSKSTYTLKLLNS